MAKKDQPTPAPQEVEIPTPQRGGAYRYDPATNSLSRLDEQPEQQPAQEPTKE